MGDDEEHWVAQTEITGTSLAYGIPPGIMEGFLEEPGCGSITDTYTLTISGWVVGFASPAVSIELIHAFTTLRSIPINLPRPDVMAAIAPDAEPTPCGFAAAIGVLGLAPDFTIDVVVTFADGLRVHWQTIRGRRAPLPIPFQPTIHPLLVTSLGRTGTSLIMSILNEHPEIVVEPPFPFETRNATYWLHMLKTLTEPAGQWDALAAAYNYRSFAQVIPSPESYPYYPHEPPVRRWLDGEYVERFGAFCQSTIEAYYTQVAASQGETRPRYYAEKHFPGIIPTLQWELDPQARELFAVRDFRDMFASTIHFLIKTDSANLAPGESIDMPQIIEQLRGELLMLTESWQRRSARAHVVRYEDLVLRSPETIAGIYTYLELDSSPGLIDRVISRAFADSDLVRGHRTTATVQDSIGRWRRDLAPAIQAACNEAFADALRAFGYD